MVNTLPKLAFLSFLPPLKDSRSILTLQWLFSVCQIERNFPEETDSFLIIFPKPVVSVSPAYSEWTYDSWQYVRAQGRLWPRGSLPFQGITDSSFAVLHPFFQTDSYPWCSLNFLINILFMFQLLSKTDTVLQKPNFQPLGLPHYQETSRQILNHLFLLP